VAKLRLRSTSISRSEKQSQHLITIACSLLTWLQNTREPASSKGQVPSRSHRVFSRRYTWVSLPALPVKVVHGFWIRTRRIVCLSSQSYVQEPSLRNIPVRTWMASTFCSTNASCEMWRQKFPGTVAKKPQGNTVSLHDNSIDEHTVQIDLSYSLRTSYYFVVSNAP